MSLDFLTARLNHLKKSSEQIAALDEIRIIRTQLLGSSVLSGIASEEALNLGAQLVRKGSPPFQDDGFLTRLNWEKCAELVLSFLDELAKAGLKNGSLASLRNDLARDGDLTRALCQASFEKKPERLTQMSTKYGVEAELLRLIAITPLIPIFKGIISILPPQEVPVQVRGCTLCGSAYSLGVYQGGFRFMLCFNCGHKVRVDYFFCPRCGNTEPQSLGFVRLEQEPVLQVDYCRKCNGYFKMVYEDLLGVPLSDPVLLDLSTMDLDSVGKEKLKESA